MATNGIQKEASCIPIAFKAITASIPAGGKKAVKRPTPAANNTAITTLPNVAFSVNVMGVTSHLKI